MVKCLAGMRRWLQVMITLILKKVRRTCNWMEIKPKMKNSCTVLKSYHGLLTQIVLELSSFHNMNHDNLLKYHLNSAQSCLHYPLQFSNDKISWHLFYRTCTTINLHNKSRHILDLRKKSFKSQTLLLRHRIVLPSTCHRYGPWRFTDRCWPINLLRTVISFTSHGTVQTTSQRLNYNVTLKKIHCHENKPVGRVLLYGTVHVLSYNCILHFHPDFSCTSNSISADFHVKKWLSRSKWPDVLELQE